MVDGRPWWSEAFAKEAVDNAGDAAGNAADDAHSAAVEDDNRISVGSESIDVEPSCTKFGDGKLCYTLKRKRGGNWNSCTSRMVKINDAKIDNLIFKWKLS